MKIKFTTSRLVNFFIISLFLFFLLFILLQWGTLHYQLTRGFSPTSLEVFTSQDTLPPIHPSVSEQLPYYRYKQIKDSLERRRQMKNGLPTGGTSSIGILSTTTQLRCDTCSANVNSWKNELTEAHSEYFLRLLWWKLEPTDEPFSSVPASERFHVENGQSYLRKRVPEQSNPKRGNAIDQPVAFRYDAKADCILIPISKSVKEALDILFMIMALGIIGYFMLVIVGSFLSFLIDLSKGEVFTDPNLKRLRTIAWSLSVYLAVTFLINLSFRLFFSSYFTDDVVLSEKSWQSWELVLISLVSFLIYKAFKQGKKLKKEQELTI